MYKGLVVVEQNGEKFILETPAYCGIGKGDTVVTEGDKTGKVVDLINISTNDKYYIFLSNFYGKFRRVLGRLDYIECHYEEEEA